MKVTTDACVFGAWIPGPLYGPVLDAGTGTGLLSLMLAQRFPEAHFTAVELDQMAFLDAAHNFRNAPFASRLTAVQADVLTYSSPVLFNAIVCNPPFFLNALPSQRENRKLARHVSGSFSIKGFLSAVERLLHPNGSLFLLLPPAEAKVWLKEAAAYSLAPIAICCLQHDVSREPHRWMLALQHQSVEKRHVCNEVNMQIFEKGVYSPTVRTLLSPFYLHLD